MKTMFETALGICMLAFAIVCYAAYKYTETITLGKWGR